MRLRAPQWAALALMVSLALYIVVRTVIHPSSIDLLVYRVEGDAVRTHQDLYGPLQSPQGLPATYPPFAACVFVALTFVPLSWLPAFGVIANVGLLLVVAVLSCRLAGIERPERVTIAMLVAAVAIWSEPVFTTLRNGQINLLLVMLALVDFTGVPNSKWKGVGTGIAAGLKVTPVLFIAYLALTGRLRAAATASATFAATIGIAAWVSPGATRRYWTSLIFDTTRVGHIEDEGNQSVTGALARVLKVPHATTVSTIVVMTVLVGGMACAVYVCRRLGDSWGMLTCAAVALLVAPVAWTHHWVWIVPIGVLLWRDARVWILPTLAVFCSYLVWAVPHGHVGAEFSIGPALVLLSASYPLWALGFLTLASLRGRRRTVIAVNEP